MSGRTGRAPGLVGLGWGLLLLTGGDRLWRGLTGVTPSPLEHRVVAVLGARHVGQGLLQAAAPARLTRLWLLTDLAHAASMLALAAAGPARRRPALLSAAVSGADAGLLGRVVRRGRATTAPVPLVAPRRARRARG